MQPNRHLRAALAKENKIVRIKKLTDKVKKMNSKTFKSLSYFQ